MSSRIPEVLSRRDLVILGVRVVTGAVVLSVVGCNDSEPAKGATEPTDLVLPAGFDLASMRIVGKKYLELHPETLSKLLTELKPTRGFPALDVEIRKQYASGEVVRVDGWVLAVTEARIYAVVALHS
jgi:hypothetical protein